ncbi:hypothetical protein [Pseudomonas sp. 6D_7.1_Bac1]|uniref:hypothetical protein n=1 Tax=Pseudomonas sp. 6D_7.1_Bac1 TaxID=2971615 RepID=UPI0021C9D9FC|nr:hypothetical protein [Pseudomonas sp. 6D_7.1_Bac1]MCU1752688.1 hypothetical protein [Pseudomonas sp. 6D_7.1_Bac1]
MRALMTKFGRLLDQGLNKEVFDNLRNLLMCTLLLAAGTDALRSPSSPIFHLFGYWIAGWGLIALAVALMLLNMCDGLRKLAKTRYHLSLQIVLCLLYVVLAFRIVEIVWSFRAS